MKTGRPRLPEHRSKTEVLQVRITKSERAAIERLAKSMGMTISEWFRASVGLNRSILKGPVGTETGRDTDRSEPRPVEGAQNV